MTRVLDVVVKCINEILAKGLKHRQFESFLLERNTQYKDLVHHFQVCWLSQGKVLLRFFSYVEKIRIFLQEKCSTLKTKSGANVLMLLRDSTWLVDLIFLVDITQHTSNLGIGMQGHNQLFPVLMQLMLFKAN